MIDEHFWEEVKFGGQLSHVRKVVQCIVEGLIQGEESSFGVIQRLAMQFYICVQIGRQTGQVVQNDAGVRKVRPTMEPIIQANETFRIVILLPKFGLTRR